MSAHAPGRKRLVLRPPPLAECCWKYCTATAASRVCACCCRGPLSKSFNPFGPSKEDAFKKVAKSPPQEIDWENEKDRRIVAAALVNAVYLLQSERTSFFFHGRRSVARGWWEGHGFDRVFNLYEGTRTSGPILGTIFRYNPNSDHITSKNAASAPAFVIAFRGTANLWDALIDAHFVIGSVELTDRMVHAKNRVKQFIHEDPRYKSAPRGSRHKLWITGHSLGAAVTISVGMSLLQDRVDTAEFDTFLFNPPFVSLDFVTDIPKTLMRCSCWMFLRQLRKIEYIVGDVLSKLFCDETEDPDDDLLYRWLPNLFVNPMDPISMGFIPYFENGRNENEKDKWVLASLKTSKGLKVDIGADWSKRLSLSYLLRSARMYVNRDREKKKAVQHPKLKMLRYWCCCGPLCIDYKTQECWISLFKSSHSLSHWYDRKVEVEGKNYIHSSGVAKKNGKGKKVTAQRACCAEGAATETVTSAVPSTAACVELDGGANTASSP